MIIRKEWINDKLIFNNKLQLEEANSRYEIQKTSNEGYDVLIDDKYTERVIIRESSNVLNEFKEERKIFFDLISKIHNGSLILFKNQYWIISTNSTVEDNLVYKNAKIKLCNENLKWVNNAGDETSVPCVLTDKVLYTNGLDETKVMTLLDGKYSIIIPYNDNTSQIDIGYRFMFDKKTYKTTKCERIAQKGLINLLIESDVTDTIDDNKDKGICNYYSRIHKKTLTLLNSPSIQIQQGNTYQIQLQATDNGNIVTNPVITYTSDNTSICTVDSNGLITSIGIGNCNIKCVYDTCSVNVVVEIMNVVITTTDNYTINLTPLGTNNITTIIYNHNKTFNAVVQNNGVDTSDTVTFELFNVDTNYTFDKLGSITSSTGNSCVVQTVNNTSMIGKKFGLRCKIVGHESVFVERVVKVGSNC